MGNVFENVSIPACPEIEAYKRRMIKLGAEAALMSGSGSAVFGIFGTFEAAEEARLGFMAAEPSGGGVWAI